MQLPSLTRKISLSSWIEISGQVKKLITQLIDALNYAMSPSILLLNVPRHFIPLVSFVSETRSKPNKSIQIVFLPGCDFQCKVQYIMIDSNNKLIYSDCCNLVIKRTIDNAWNWGRGASLLHRISDVDPPNCECGHLCESVRTPAASIWPVHKCTNCLVPTYGWSWQPAIFAGQQLRSAASSTSAPTCFVAAHEFSRRHTLCFVIR